MTDKQTRIAELKDRMRGLRMGQPVLWAIVRGCNSKFKIGFVTGLSPKEVDQELEKLVKSKTVINYYGKTWLLNKKGENYDGYQELAKFSALVEAKWVSETTPEEVEKHLALLTTPAQARFKAEKRTHEAEQPQALTQKQQDCWDQISGWLEDQGRSGEPFTTREAAKAQGFDKPGFTKNQLLSLVKKNRVRDLGGRPQKWELVSSKPTLE